MRISLPATISEITQRTVRLTLDDGQEITMQMPVVREGWNEGASMTVSVMPVEEAGKEEGAYARAVLNAILNEQEGKESVA